MAYMVEGQALRRLPEGPGSTPPRMRLMLSENESERLHADPVAFLERHDSGFTGGNAPQIIRLRADDNSVIPIPGSDCYFAICYDVYGFPPNWYFICFPCIVCESSSTLEPFLISGTDRLPDFRRHGSVTTSSGGRVSSLVPALNSSTANLGLVMDSIVGRLSVYTTRFEHGDDRTVITRASLGEKRLYRGLYSIDDDATVYVELEEDGAATKILMYDSPDGTTGYVIVSNDHGDVNSFTIDIDNFIESRDQEGSITSGNAAQLDQVGSRKPVALNPLALAEEAWEDADYREFMGNQMPDVLAMARAPQQNESTVNWKCAWICLIPACGLSCLFWKPNKKKKQKRKLADLDT